MQSTPLVLLCWCARDSKICQPTSASVAVLLEHMQCWLLFPVPHVPAEKGAILGEDGATGPEGICSLLEFVHSDILLEACAVWKGGFTEVTGWVLPAGVKLMQTIGKRKQLLWIKLCRSSDLSENGFIQETSCSGSFSFCPSNVVRTWIF